jgi:hypothetical protein
MTSYNEIKKQIENLRDENHKPLPQIQVDRASERCTRAEELRIEPPTALALAGFEIYIAFGGRGSLYVLDNGGIRLAL